MLKQSRLVPSGSKTQRTKATSNSRRPPHRSCPALPPPKAQKSEPLKHITRRLVDRFRVPPTARWCMTSVVHVVSTHQQPVQRLLGTTTLPLNTATPQHHFFGVNGQFSSVTEKTARCVTIPRTNTRSPQNSYLPPVTVTFSLNTATPLFNSK